ncbi:MAG: NAD(+) diphosphatase [Gammaproteobacteria bacterium]|nr:NAD(+) diphosphatase [Gammaproteobacteria bacterium]
MSLKRREYSNTQVPPLFKAFDARPSKFISETEPPAGLDVADALYFVCLGDDLLSISEQGVPRPVTADEFRWVDLEVDYKHYLGRWEGRACYALRATGSVPEGFALAGLRAWLGRVEPDFFSLAGRAKQIVEWHRDHRPCGRCGAPNQDHPTDRAKLCPSCGLTTYPRLSPSIIVLVRRGEEMLLARNAAWPSSMFSTLAGFVEPGESIEQTVHREVGEEVGLAVENLRYLGSQSWPFPNSLMLGFHADYRAGEIVCRDGEIAEARWFHFSQLPNVPGGTAISRWLIDAFVDEMSRKRSHTA